MNDDPSKRRLGRGLAALIGEMDQPIADMATRPSFSADRKVAIDLVVRNPKNPRKHFAEEDLQDLASSIRQHGIVQPVVVRPVAESKFEIIAGERRWRAAQLAGLNEIPVLIREVDDRTALELAIVENVQRADLNPVEEAQGYEQLIAEHGYTQNDLGEIIGKSRSHVANSLRLLKLPDLIRDMITSGTLSAGHARALIPTSDPVGLARTIIAKGMSVRDAERIAQNNIRAQSQPALETKSVQKDPDTLALERTLSDSLGLEVTVNHKGNGGRLTIAYKSLEQLENICSLLERHQ